MTATVAAAALAVAVLFILVYYAAYHGASQFSLGFLVDQLPPYGGVGGGIGPALAGTAEVVLIATVIALPVGILTAIYLSEFARPARRRDADDRARADGGPADDHLRRLHLRADRHPQRAVGRSPPRLALAIVEVPLIARASVEAHPARPGHAARGGRRAGRRQLAHRAGRDPAHRRQRHRHRDDPGGCPRRRRDGARCCSPSNAFQQAYQLNPLHAMPTVPMEILNLLNSGQPAAVAKAWGAAFLLMIVILAVNIGARVWLRRSERKRGL